MELGVLERVGQLPEWHDQGQRKRGAYVYALNVVCPKLGDRVRDGVRRARDRLAEGPSPLECSS